MVFCGIDWAEEQHDVCVVDAEGRRLWRGRVAHEPSGIAQLRSALAALAPDPAQVVVGIETGRGLLVGELVLAGYVVYPINPKSAERYRDRRRASGGKDDRLDAEVLANAVRTDRAVFRPLLPDSDLAVEIATLARDHAALTRHHTRLLNQLRSALLEYFPAAVRAFALDAKSAQAFLERYAEPAAAARLSVAQITRFCAPSAPTATPTRGPQRSSARSGRRRCAPDRRSPAPRRVWCARCARSCWRCIRR